MNEEQIWDEYDRHRVSCKIALLNREGTRILLARYEDGSYGLPGGHIDGDEKPDEALVRELKEEFSIEYKGPIVHGDFFRTRFGKIVLASVGFLDESTRLSAGKDEKHEPLWVDITDIENGTLSTGDYDSFILSNVHRGETSA